MPASTLYLSAMMIGVLPDQQMKASDL